MKSKHPVYIKSFSRDFTLAIIEIWYRAEALNPKQWTNKKQPFQPFIVFERVGGIVNGYYDPCGIDWVKKELITKARADKRFFAFLEKTITKEMKYFKPIFESSEALPQKKLVEFLENLEEYWIWFEAAWWLWESTPEERRDFDLPESFKKLREETQNLAPGSDIVIRKSLQKLYPRLDNLIVVLTTDEITSSKIPDKTVLQERYKQCILTNNLLYVNTSKERVARKLGIDFEKLKVKDTKEIKGQSAQKGIANGPVKIIMSAAEIEKVRVGDILVAPMTLPAFIPGIKKSAAIVTDEGGIMCHAAIISRELNIPCIIGTKIATKVFKDGDLVEVDADKGVVRKL